MIIDPKLGVKIAENKEEALWERVRKESESLIEQSENNLIIQKEMNRLAREKLKKYHK